MMLLRRKIRRFANRLIGISPEPKIHSRYGKLLLTVGKWKVTSKGILLERNKFGECDYFLTDSSLLDADHLVDEIHRLQTANWLTEIDCYQFVLAWHEKVSQFKGLSRDEFKHQLWWLFCGSTVRFLKR